MAMTIRLYWAVNSRSRDSDTVIRPVWIISTCESYLYTFLLYIGLYLLVYAIAPYLRVLDLEWDRGVTEGVCNL